MTAQQFYPLLSEGVELQKLFAQNPGGLQSGSAPAIASAGTISTAGPPQLGVSRLAPAAAVTGVIIQPGTTDGQQCWVVNEATNAAYTITFDVAGTSNVADGTSDVIQANQARLYVWDSVKSLWYSTPQIINTVSLTQSSSAAATASSGTITTSGVQVARVAPTAAITAAVMQAGTIAGQLCLVVNEAAVANSVEFAASGTSNVADGVNDIIPGLSAQLYIWDSGTSLWYEISPSKVSGALASIQSAAAAATASSGTITTAGVGVARIAPTAAITALVLQAGVYPGQEVVVINESTTGSNSATMAASGTSNVANGTATVISGLTCAKLIWDSGTSLWYHAV